MDDTIVDFNSGRRTERMVRRLPARCSRDASSKLVEIWLRADMPPLMPTGMARMAIVIIRMAAVPVNSMGAVLKARM
jgi:hypothetical protein